MLSRVLVVLCLLVGLARAQADATGLLRGLDTDDPARLSAGVTAIENAPTTPELADVLFAAGRATEDRLHDPARALKMYERILRELPDAGVAIAAGRRAAQLRGAKDHAREAAELAQLIANADALPAADVERRAEALAGAAWPGAPDAALWLGDWLCRTGRYADADRRFTALMTDPSSPHGKVARRNAASCAIEAKQWARAEELARGLPQHDAIDEAVRADLLAGAATGRHRARLYTTSWIAVLVAFAALLASLAEAMLRGGRRAPPWQPPVEVLYIGPIAIVVVAASFAIDSAVAPAVAWISIAGVVLAWLSGATLDLLRARDRSVRLRSLLHALACGAAVLGVGYIAVTRAGLVDMFSETVQFGPGGH